MILMVIVDRWGKGMQDLWRCKIWYLNYNMQYSRLAFNEQLFDNDSFPFPPLSLNCSYNCILTPSYEYLFIILRLCQIQHVLVRGSFL